MPSTPCPPSFRSASRPCLALAFACFVALSIPGVAPAAGAGELRDRFPAGAIDSIVKADSALAAADGEKLRVERDYQATARECMKKFMVNDCLDAARTVRRDRLSDIEALRIEANRYKRRDKADRIESERAKREAERAANAKADAELRARNREAYESRQRQAKREAADRAREGAARAGRPPAARGPLIKSPKPGSPEAQAAQRAKNAAAVAARIREAAAHREQLARRHAQREAERARRAQDRAKKEAERNAARHRGDAVVKPGS